MSDLVIEEKVIKSVKGSAIPKPKNDQNTDDIVPARYLREITFEKMGEYVYIDERIKDGGEVKDHVFNDPKFKGAKILIAGANYGCGSSREHAPQALHRFGINAIIAESFAEIFAGNCASLGVVGVTISGENITRLVNFVKDNPSSELEVDLVNKSIRFGENTVEFGMLEGRRKSFLNGTWDAMAILQKNDNQVKETMDNLEYLSFK